MKVDIKTVQEILRHRNLKTTLEVYAKAMREEKLEAQGVFLEELWNSGRGSSVGQYETLITSKRRPQILPAQPSSEDCLQSVRICFRVASLCKMQLDGLDFVRLDLNANHVILYRKVSRWLLHQVSFCRGVHACREL